MAIAPSQTALYQKISGQADTLERRIDTFSVLKAEEDST